MVNRWISSVITQASGNDEYTILGAHEYNTNYDIEYSPDGGYLGVALGNELVVYDLLSGDKYLGTPLAIVMFIVTHTITYLRIPYLKISGLVYQFFWDD